jgi:hypothetical protein
MDGRQRLTTLSEFYANNFELTGLEYWPELDGRKYSELPSKIRDGIDRRYLSSIVLLKETATSEEEATKLKKMVFERLNSGGVKLSSQEARNAIFNGRLNKLCFELSENSKFRRMWGIPLNQDPEVKDDDENYDLIETIFEEFLEGIEDKSQDKSYGVSTKTGKNLFEKMEDVELVLRFFAYRHIGEFKTGLNNISDFLDRFIIVGNDYPEVVLDGYRDIFAKTIDFLWATLASDAFTDLDKKRPIKIIYDPLMFIASHHFVVNHYEALIENKTELREALKSMYAATPKLFSGRSTNFIDTMNRNKRMNDVFTNVINNIITRS